ncbi:agamous-like MADS-box protein AGL29 [Bidens hawaiensis]|uniref:agamous-like MADS-box protein AGL29 n=1 Tax=Bidens hawaiensis TaxID=980011 RepID=UPI00404B85FC
MARSRGRQKIEMKLIENESNRAVTLSKRYGSLFKKAGELATLCGAWIAIIVFTISGRPLAFGSPHVDSATKKFLCGDEQDAIQASINSSRRAKIEALNNEYNEFNEKSTSDKKLRQNLEEEVKVFLGGITYEDYKRTMGINQLMEMKSNLEQLKTNLQYSSDEESGSSFDDECEPDLSTIEGPRDFLQL